MRNKLHDERLHTEVGDNLFKGRKDYTLRKTFFLFIRDEVLEKDAVTDKQREVIMIVAFRTTSV